MTDPTTPPEPVEARDLTAEEDAAFRLRQWAECVMRLMAVAPTSAVKNETGVRGGSTTPPERKAIREAAQRVVEGWLERDLAALASPKGGSDD